MPRFLTLYITNLLQAWLQLIRWQNLLIIALTQLLAWWCIVLPQQPQVLHSFNMLLLSLSTVLIAAAGYIINDYFDIKIDQVNNPSKVVLGKVIDRKHAIKAHIGLNVLALALATYVAISAHHLLWPALQSACIALLWFYSTTFKRRYISGNVIVSLLTALTIITIIVYEPTLLLAASRPLSSASQPGTPSSLPFWMLGYYSYFAFILTWIREIVKDMQDLQGDEADGCVTLPIVRGLRYATYFATILALAAIIPLSISAAVLLIKGYWLLGIYILALLSIPLLLWCMYLWKRATTQHYAICSRFLKIIMVLGILSLLIYKIQ